MHSWLARYEEAGLEGLIDRSHRPANCPHQMPAAVEATLLELRRSRPYWGPKRLVFELAKRKVSPVPSESAAYRALVRARMIESAGSAFPEVETPGARGADGAVADCILRTLLLSQVRPVAVLPPDRCRTVTGGHRLTHRRASPDPCRQPGRLGHVEYEHELYAERLRRQVQAAAITTGAAQWTDQLDTAVRMKLFAAWQDATVSLDRDDRDQIDSSIKHRTLRSLADDPSPQHMRPGVECPNNHLLSLIEAEHEILQRFAEILNDTGSVPYQEHQLAPMLDAPERFRADVNRIFESHIVAFHLHQNSRLVPIDSHEIHDAVVAPTLYLLHSQPRFAHAETAYQNALKELRNRDPADAITDAATALQEVLMALGCAGGALGDLISSAKRNGLLNGADTPLTESIVKTVNWVAAKRNQGEAHRGDPQFNMSDAWMVVHVVGALVIRLSETDQPASK